MKKDSKRTKLLTRRAVLLAGGEVALLGTLAARLYYLQVVQAQRYSLQADENRIDIRLLAPPRGRILDRFGVPLATNRPTNRVVLVAEQAGNIPKTLDAVGTLIPLSDADRRRVLHDIRSKPSFVPVVIRDDLSWDEMARIEVNALELPGVSIERGLTRYYPFDKATSHTVGYVGPATQKDLSSGDPLLELPDFLVGKTGIEKSYDLDLRGTAGTSEVEVNAYGRVVRELARDDGIPGQDIALGIDMELQALAMERCAAQGSASCVVLDAWTGEVLVMASAPGFDPGDFVSGLTPAAWHKLSTDPFHPLDNKAISGTYAPGSTFKPSVAIAGLESGVITPETEFFCPGYWRLGDHIFHCWERHGHVKLNRAIRESCDVYFYHVAYLLGIDRIAAMAKRFGLGVKLGIDIPGEKGGLIPTRAWKQATYGVSWQPGDTVVCGIGQGYVSVTPLQLATYVARLVTGRAVQPRIARREGVMTRSSPLVKAVAKTFAPMGLQQKNLDVVLQGMYGVVNELHGTGYEARIKDPSMAMGGKTGTAQVHNYTAAEREHGVLTGASIPWKERDDALFIAYAPVSAPRYVCSVVVEHGGKIGGEGGAVAAPIAHDVLLEAQKRAPLLRVPEHLFEAPTKMAES